MKSSAKAYVITISAGTGCYRHLKISADTTLAELSEEILDAFEFMDDHAHAFFMDNRAWSDVDSYYMGMDDEDDDDERHTSDYTLHEAGFITGKKFVYVFDFGDDWRFQCQVLKELDTAMVKPEIVRSVGKPPIQYELKN